MNIQEALLILQLDTIPNMVNLKRCYHKMALQHHPDKNGNSLASKEFFQRIGEAYDVLKREISILDEDEPVVDSGYSSIVNIFIDGLLKGHYNEVFLTIVKDIVSGAKKISIKLFEHMDKERMMRMFDFLFKYKDLLNIEKEELDSLQQIILEKYKDVQIYILHPSIEDLFDHKIYMLKQDGFIYYVPLWHSELVFDIPDGGGEMIVKCNPILPEHISIDENNNVLVTWKFSFTFSLLEKEFQSINIGSKNVLIPTDKLLCKKIQTFVFKGQGISKICEKDMYSDDILSDIIVKIVFY